MLDLDDPLWVTLGKASGHRAIPARLQSLSQSWDEEAANSLFYGDLCHQQTCYGSTYAAIPHLLEIAIPAPNVHQRREIAPFLGHVVLCATNPHLSQGENDLPQGLQPLGNETDRAKIEVIRREFFDALPTVRAICQTAFHENIDDPYLPLHLLAGIAAADGLCDLADLVESGQDGVLSCASCGWRYEYILFDDRIAIYADNHEPGATVGRSPADDLALQDYRDGTPTRSDGFLSPVSNAEDIADERIKALLVLADKAPSPTPALLLRNFLGSFDCLKCQTSVAVKGI